LAEVDIQARRYAEATEILNAALRIRGENALPEDRSTWELWSTLAFAYQQLGLMEKALAAVEKAIAVADESAAEAKHVRYAALLHQRGEILEGLERYAAALEMHLEGLELNRELQADARRLAASFRQVGNVLSELGQHEAAERAWLQALERLERSDELTEYAETLVELGRGRLRAGRPSGALKSLREAVALLETADASMALERARDALQAAASRQPTPQ
jgi:tetratricopeptide (TPR) repeat protein